MKKYDMTRRRKILSGLLALTVALPSSSHTGHATGLGPQRRSAVTIKPNSSRIDRLKSKSLPAHGGSLEAQKSGTIESSIGPLGVLRASSLLFFIGTALTAFSPAHALVANLGTERATSTLSALSASAALAQIVLSPAVGSTLDSVGRKPVLVAACVSLTVCQSMVSASPSVLSICAAKVMGVFGIGLFFIASQAIIGDVAADNPERMSSAMGLTMATTSGGFLVGTIIAGRLAELGLSITYGASSIVTSLAALLVGLCMPETLPSSERVPWEGKKLLQSPLSSTRILFRHGSKVRILAIILMLQTLPINMGDFFQIFAKTEWNVSTKEFSSFVAVIGVLGILSNTAGSILVHKLGIRRFTAIATLSSMCSSIGAAFFEFRGLFVGTLVGFLGAASTLGITAALVLEGHKTGIPQGELAGERAAILGLLKVIGPIWYSNLYVQGRKWWGLTNLPFFFNLGLAMTAFAISQLQLG